MELILINDNKLKITLSECDMKQYSLDCNTIDYDSTETRRAFWSILDEVKHKTGFDAARQKVFVQLYPSKEGGCEMFVTKLGNTKKSENENEEVSDSHRLHPLHRRKRAFSFHSFKEITAVCRHLSHTGYSDSSSVWYVKDGEKKYILIFEEPEENVYIPLNECSFVCEYGRSENLKNTLLFLGEHAELICKDNAVEMLAEF